MVYTHLLRPLFFQFDPELVHNQMVNLGEFMGKSPLGRGVIRAVYGHKDSRININIDGIAYHSPVLLAAGFDYNGRLTQILPSIGFGGEEIGSVTLRPSEGNPQPRLTRLPKNNSIIVNKGLRNHGVDALISLLQSRPQIPGFVRGVSVARSNVKETTGTQAGIDDYVQCYQKLVNAGVGDYYTLNISCPNAFGGEAFSEPELLRQLLSAVNTVRSPKPLYLKMPINKLWPEFRELLAIADNFGINGVIIGNLNKNYDDLAYRDEAPGEYRGGLSGKPCQKLSNELIRRTKETYGDRFIIFGCGGIMSAADANEKLDAGADLLQLITGMIYKGPGIIGEINKAYTQREF